MKKPPIPKNDHERILQLLSYNILDTASEEEYDQLAELAASLSGSSIALVSLVDTNRQWFKSCVGISGVSETSRDVSFCAHAITSKEDIFIIDDPLNDDRFRDNPLVTGEMHVRFYAGVPLIDSNNFALGTLCIVDSNYRVISDDQKTQLKIIANQIVKLMELRRVQIKLKENYQELNSLTQKNIEQQYLLENALKEAAKLSAIGELSASIAHEIKNSLFIISATCETLETFLGSSSEDLKSQVKYSIVDINENLERVDKIIKGLSNNSRIVKDEFKPVKIKQVIDNSIALVSGKLKKNGVNVSTSLGSEEVEVFGRHSDIGQVLVNLISNSVDAISELHIKDKWIKIEVLQDDEKTKISVIDCGGGISEEISESLFDSFFTTKEIGKGTGLGLSISKKIIEDHQGLLYYEKNRENTSFVIELPIVS